MTSDKLNIFCVTNKTISHIEKSNYKIAAVGKGSFPDTYLKSDTLNNIFYKEEYYSELTFHYWYWKNLLKISDNNWIGFCQKRRFWIKSSSSKHIISKENIKEHLLVEPENDWNKYQSIICKPISVAGAKRLKILKRGWRSLIKNPSILFNEEKQNIKLHFDMHHGYGNLERAIDLLDVEDKSDFNNYVINNSIFNPHIMFITKKDILNKWFSKLFPWLEKCENQFGFDNLKGYDTKRLYAFLAERYLSFWFKKYTVYKEHPWVFIDI